MRSSSQDRTTDPSRQISATAVSVTLEVGHEPKQLPEKRVFLRTEYSNLDFEKARQVLEALE